MPDKKDKNVTAYTTTGSLVGLAGALLLRKLTAPKKGAGLGSYALWGSVGAGLGGLTGYGLATVDTSKHSPEQREQLNKDVNKKIEQIKSELSSKDRRPGWLQAFWFPLTGLGTGTYLMRKKLFGDDITSNGILDLESSLAKLKARRKAGLLKFMDDAGVVGSARKALIKSVGNGNLIDLNKFNKFDSDIKRINKYTSDIIGDSAALKRLKGLRWKGRGLAMLLPISLAAAGSYFNSDEISDWWNTSNNPWGINFKYRSTSELNKELETLNKELAKIK